MSAGATGGGGASPGGSGGAPLIIGAGGGVQSGLETCNGLDDDADGIIDNVDVNSDGVCDCLNIATLGYPGGWGNGNVFANWLNQRSSTPAVALGDQVLDAATLAPFQVIVSLDVLSEKVPKTIPIHAYTAAEASALEAWVRAGGGLMTTTGYAGDTENANVNTLLAFSGMSYCTQMPCLYTERLPGGNPAGYIKNWAVHPITDKMGTAYLNNGWEPAGAGTAIGWNSQNQVVLRVLEIDAGRIAMWGDEWITYDATWNNVTGLNIELFWLNLLKWLSPPNQCQVPIPPTVY
jgi:hypothetical protein